jgi:hypothetical protein
MEFGYFPHPIDEQFGPVSIQTLPNLDHEVSLLEQCEFVHDRWFYAPREVWVDVDTGERDERPNTRRLFSLPMTHLIEGDGTNDESHLLFIVRCLGFFVGMRLSSGFNDFVDNTPIRKGQLCDFLYSKREMNLFVNKVDAFWNCYGQCLANRIATIIHLNQMGQRRNLLNYESFVHLYMAVDAVYRVYLEMSTSVGKAPSHAERVLWLCEKLGIPTPSWASMMENKSELSIERNFVFHEGQTKNGKTVGYSIIDQYMLYEMANFISRALFSLLHVKCLYSKTPVNTRQTHGLDFTI